MVAEYQTNQVATDLEIEMPSLSDLTDLVSDDPVKAGYVFAWSNYVYKVEPAP